MTVGILCEKPSAMRNFSRALGGKSGSFNGEKFVISCARGHLYEFCDIDKLVKADLSDTYRLWKIDYLPWDVNQINWKKKIKKGCTSVVNNIKKDFAGVDEIVVAGDVDSSGEGYLLCQEVLDKIPKVKKYSRMYFLDEAPKTIQKSFRERKVISNLCSDPEFLKSDYRSKWDFLSMQFTRIASCLVGRCVLRQGRLKSAMVVLVGDQLRAISEYKKIPFYENRFKDNHGVVYTNKEEQRYEKREDVPQIYHESDVVLDKRENKRKAPPKLLDLAALSSLLSPKGFGAKEVLAVYQKMYEAQIVSYPRTDDKTITQEQFDELLPLVDRIAGVVGVDKGLLTHRTSRKTHVKSGGSHGANRPGVNVPKSLDELSKYGKCGPIIYEILAKNYLAMLAEDYEYERQTGHVAEYPKFIGACNVPKKLGFKAVFNIDWDDKGDEDDIKEGLGNRAKPFVHEGFPPKPQYPTMKWLMKQLEKRNVGTGATRTSIYAEVVNPKYKYPLLIEKRGRLSMHKYGDLSYKIIQDTNIASLDLTEKVLSQMKDIEKGQANGNQLLAEVAKLVVADIDIMKKNRKELAMSDENMQEVEYVEGELNGKSIKFKRVQRGHRLSDDEVKTLLGGGVVTSKFTSKAGNEYEMSGGLKEMEYSGNKYWGVDYQFVQDDSKYHYGKFNGKDIKFKKKLRDHEITDGEAADLLAGKEVEFEFVSAKTGKPYSMIGKLAQMEYQGNKYWGVDLEFVNNR